MTSGSSGVVLGEVLDVASGQVDPREPPYCDCLHVGGDNIESDTGRLFGMRRARDLNLISGKYEFGPEDVLYSKIRPALNKVALPDFRGICSADMYPLRPRKGDLDRRYLAYLLRHEDFLTFAEKHSSRTNIPKINRDALLAYRVTLPKMPEQRRIADILDKADAVRRKRREAIALTEELLRSTFLEMFGDPVTNPRGWEVRPLGEIADVGSGVAKGKRYEPGTTVSVPYMRVANVQDGHLALDDVAEITVSEAEAKRYLLRDGDVLLTEGGDPDKLGRGAVWRGEVPKCIHQNHIFRVRPMSDVLPEYLSALIASPRGKRYFLRAAKQTTGIATINMTQLRGFPALIPPLSVQARYAAFLDRWTRAMGTQRGAAGAQEALFASLVHRAFRGELGRA